ncbi:MAG: DinB family protein [Acidobacteriota bacterium]
MGFMIQLIGLFLLITSALAAQPLTRNERNRAISELHATRKLLQDAVAGLKVKQLNFKPNEKSWSIAEIVEHLAVVEDGLFATYQQVAGGPAVAGAKSAFKDEDYLKVIRSRDQKVQAPESMAPKKTFPSTPKALEAFNQRRLRNIDFLDKTRDEDLRRKILSGQNIDAYQIFLLLAAHAERHVSQINELKSNARYPRS